MKQLIILFVLAAICSCKNTPAGSEMKELNVQLKTVADSVSGLMSKYHYNPEELASEEYIELEGKVQELAKKSQTKQEFVDGYNKLWTEGPFSHVRLAKMEQPANQIASYIDSLRVGDQSVSLEWINKTAMLTVNTMMGVDTQERIFEAYQQIAEKRTDTLIIDLRNNGGGTFAGIPLIGHLVKDTTDIGMFVSQKWWRNNTNEPTIDDIKNLQPWKGWSIKTFWQDVQNNPLTRVQIVPMYPHFEGPVYVLTSNKTASAAEFTTDALARMEKVTIIGQITSGEMLSQKMFDLPYGLQISLPIADYFSTRIGRIEGKGVNPDITVDQSAAKELSLALIKGAEMEDALAKVQEKLSNKEK